MSSGGIWWECTTRDCKTYMVCTVNEEPSTPCTTCGIWNWQIDANAATYRCEKCGTVPQDAKGYLVCDGCWRDMTKTEKKDE